MPQHSPLEFDLDDHLSAARELVTTSTPQALVTAFASLTHRLHASEDDTVSADLRTQRGIIEAEMLNRMTRPALPNITDVALNRAAQAFYDGADGAVRAMTDKPNIVNGLREALVSLGVPLLALPNDRA